MTDRKTVGSVTYQDAGKDYFEKRSLKRHGRHKLVLSPEEEFALTHGQHGHPEKEGYGTTKL